MEDLKLRIFDLAKELQLMSVATATEDGRPRVRYVVGNADPVLTLRFSTHLGSAKVQQMRNRPSVSVTTGATVQPSRIALWSMAAMRSEVWQPEA